MKSSIRSFWTFSIALLLTFFSVFSAHSENLKQTISELIQQKFPHATVGILVRDAATGKDIYRYNARKILKPASNTKVLTALAALHMLGPDFKYETSLSRKNANIYFTFSGSPSLKSSDIDALVASLKKDNIHEIKGNIILDISKFKPPYHAAGITYDDLGWYYEAPSMALILDENKEVYQFISAEKAGDPAKIKTSSSNQKALTLINQIISVPRVQEKHHCNFNIEIRPGNTLRLYGCLAQSKYPRTIQLAIPDPVFYSSQVIKTALQKQQIQFKGKVIVGKTPADAEKLATHHSPELSKLLKHMLEESDNLYADSVTKLLGYQMSGQGTYKQGAYAIRQTLAKHTPINPEMIELADGQGSRYDQLTAEQMVILFDDIYKDKKLNALFMDILPRMGVSGTLQERMKKTALKNRVMAKTGTMHDISSISGFMNTEKGRVLIFSIIINGIHKNIYAAKALEDDILLAISQHE